MTLFAEMLVLADPKKRNQLQCSLTIALANHVHRIVTMGARVLINGIWY